MTKILLDMNGKEFQNSLFKLEKQEQRALLNTLRKINKLNWEDLYQDKGIKWEIITSQKTIKGRDIYSFRFSQKYRGIAYRDGDYLVLIDLFVNHDGAYK
ncbi:MAG: hypothetical protein LBQ34_04665 [Alphaproteobacteria bacterium]|jgi:hypothetical protein|nr:hypothetical protein [Alphaproteobacteria bacterium]